MLLKTYCGKNSSVTSASGNCVTQYKIPAFFLDPMLQIVKLTFCEE